ncbi:IclR family transcriptional regulator [Paraburkholderia youngii]|uniref:IclR family transcriptional regulator n=1 Tax=Paraburkholderia youngii TaxID=2782701 RepID=UPI003D1B77CD
MSVRTSHGIQVISRAAAVLREVADHPDGRSLGQLAAATGLPRSTVQRIVDALEIEHLVQAGAGGVRPGWGLRRLGELAGPGAASELRPELYRLFEATRETVDLATLSGTEVLFMDRFLSDQRIRAVPVVGAHYPAYSMANGKALLAQLSNEEVRALFGTGALKRETTNTLSSVGDLIRQLDEIRASAFAYDREEHAMGMCAVGLSIPSPGTVRLAVSVVMPAARFDERRVTVEKALSECAAACRARLSGVR